MLSSDGFTKGFNSTLWRSFLFGILYKQLCRHLVTVDFPTDSTIRQLIVRLMMCYSQMEGDELLTSLIDNIFFNRPGSAVSPMNNPLREKILSSRWIWNQPTIVFSDNLFLCGQIGLLRDV